MIASLPVIEIPLTPAKYGLVCYQQYGVVIPNPEARIGLSVAGLRRLEIAKQLVDGYLWMLRLLCERQMTFVPDSDRAIDVKVTVSELREAAKGSPDALLVIDRVVELVTSEPPLWGAGPYAQGDEREYRLTTRVEAYVAIKDVDDYLTRLWMVLGRDAPRVERRLTSPLDLVASADYLGTVWELRTHKKLWGPTRLANAAALSYDCSTVEEFNSRLSALGDLLAQIDLPNQTGGRLDRLEKRLHDLVPSPSHGRIDDAIAAMRAARRLRAGSQHDDAAVGAIDAFALLGVKYPPADWQVAWDQIRIRMVEAFDAIREELQTAAE